MDSQIKTMEEKLQNLQAGDRTKTEVIREMEAKHRSELENHSRSSRLSSKQQVRGRPPSGVQPGWVSM